MTRIDCRSVRREIEQTRLGGFLSSLANDHMKTCVDCGKFRAEDTGLRQILSSLGTIEAPGDFDIRFRARLAQEKRVAVGPFAIRNFTFGFRSAAFATLLLLFGAVLILVSLRTRPQSSLATTAEKTSPAGEAKATAVAKNESLQPNANTTAQVDLVAAKAASSNFTQPARRRGAFRPLAVSARNNGGGLTTRDSSSTPAPVLRAGDLTAGNRPSSFPIGASARSLKVSLDNGRGSKRTISLPTVSFGSQRVLAQDASPLLATARGSW